MRRAALALAIALMPLAAPALDLTAMTEDERAAFGSAVRDYLLENPQVLVEVISVLERQQAEAEAQADLALARANLSDLQDDGFSYVGGNPDGDVTLVEFMDYRCGYCRRAFPEVDALLAQDGNIRFVIKEFPILGEQSLAAAQFAVAVQQLHGDETYKAVHDALVLMQTDITPASLAELAQTFGLDPAPIRVRMAGPEVADVLAANRALAERMQITGTPTFVIEDRMIRGYVPLPQLVAAVAEIREEAASATATED
jgi:protein-disulfide isomerase